MDEKVYSVVMNTIGEFNEEIETKIDVSKGKETELFGGKSSLDSLELVNLIITIEQNIADEFDKNITITSEKAMSRSVSPFKSVETLTNYIEELLNE